MEISIIAALAKNRVIGKDNALPWNLPADLKYFHDMTMGKTVVMGLNTFKSVGSKPLPGRKNIVLTDDKNDGALEGVALAHSVGEVLEMAKNDGTTFAKGSGKSKEIMICGGAMVYQQFLPLAQKLYITFIDHDFEGDAFFPEFDAAQWREGKREDYRPDEKNAYRYSFVVLERKS